MSRKRIVRPHNLIAQFMLDGEPKSPEAIRAHFADSERMTKLLAYKLSGYICDIRKYDDGIVKVAKNGRVVTSYQLANAELFDDQGFNVGVARSARETTTEVTPVTAEDVVVDVPVAVEVTLAEQPAA